jgi:hypothetical protein
MIFAATQGAPMKRQLYVLLHSKTPLWNTAKLLSTALGHFAGTSERLQNTFTTNIILLLDPIACRACFKNLELSLGKFSEN